ncbi:MAG: BlaI/MecI/CopY family transcriptional regulator [Capsulimonadaceae bacterium]
MPLPNVGRAEMDILRYILDHHPVTVRTVSEYVAETKGHTRTTVLNVMERLRQKGYLKRTQIDSIYHYAPTAPKAQLQLYLVRDFVDLSLGGSLAPFMAYLTEEAQVSDQEIEDLKAIVGDLEQRKRA